MSRGAAADEVSVEVCVRIRPYIAAIDDKTAKATPASLRDTHAPATITADRMAKTVTCANAPSMYNPAAGSTKKHFKFHNVFTEEDSTEAIFERCHKETVLGALDGYSVCIYGYGGTGSGKTHTLAGDEALHPRQSPTTAAHTACGHSGVFLSRPALRQEHSIGFTALAVRAVFDKIRGEAPASCPPMPALTGATAISLDPVLWGRA
jgi:hypothetical protein